ncbi:hypothetical protein IM660_15905 [Ruania alkalisoli]|uniref:Uncharacterized protein n=1 Tax=Ruania alkalisoli TaxID=2779775 RepID=A0A7M1SRB7_9MICO|nr:hypothetical protein [Ruania alkalisoli]QOR70096.1 hypothetical protein IM660_15905 [Ruania alkalisoli]
MEPLDESDLDESSNFAGAYATPLEPVTNPDPVRYDAMQQSIVTAVNACMAEQGFPEYRHEAREAAEMRIYGVTDPTVAQVWGYQHEGGISDEALDDDEPPPPQNSAPIEDEIVALIGTEQSSTEEVRSDDGTVTFRYDPDSCLYPSTLDVFPDFFTMHNLQEQAFEIQGRASIEVLESDEFADAFAEWDQCVVDAGGTAAASPSDAISREGATAELSEEQIESAVRDATCKQETGFLREWSFLQAQEEHERLAEHPGLVTEYLELLDAAAST